MELKKPLVVIAAVIGLAACGEALQPGLARQSRTTSMKDFTPERADGRTAKTMAWARKKQADAAHLGERIAESGRRHIFAYGLALDQPFPEAVAILDGLVDRARRPLRAHARPLRPQLRPLAHVAPHTAATSAAVPERPKGL